MKTALVLLLVFTVVAASHAGGYDENVVLNVIKRAINNHRMRREYYGPFCPPCCPPYCRKISENSNLKDASVQKIVERSVLQTRKCPLDICRDHLENNHWRNNEVKTDTFITI
ncbi:uncharacterized protein LOC106177190 [Lingula anatina]|uniref:Uncharacterized protein LOC106177190 n=1 Tax=Lingula anatina TaxID=7574 RepID=A0A1S3JY60_LINAN|nr:uncharacterized protein LOC106177190 [Lingula anatina]|eukprot:XP_013415350.1 uncharacterized protein LOC106177190 [Lingula anatina]